MTKTERNKTIYNDYLLNLNAPRTTYNPSKRMQYWIKKGRYEVVGDMCKHHITIHLYDAKLLAAYTSRLTSDANIYKTCKRKSKPFIVVPSSDSTAYCWRIPVTIHDN